MAKEDPADQYMSEADQDETQPYVDESAALESQTRQVFDTRTKIYEDTYAFVSNGLYGSARSGGFLKNGSNGIFYFKTYVRTATYTYDDLSEYDPSEASDESNSVAIETETDGGTSSTMTIELSSSEMSFAKRTYYNFFEDADLTLYEPYNIDDPTVTYEGATMDDTNTNTISKYSITYKDNEDDGIKEKYGTSITEAYSDMLSALSASATAVYNTTNVNRFNFKRAKAPNVHPINISALAPKYYQDTTGSATTSGTNTTTTTTSAGSSGGGGY